MVDNNSTVTVLYYEDDDIDNIQAHVLTDMRLEDDSRIIFPPSFRENKIIVAVLKGRCSLINALGDRSL
ncbi:DUF2375 family protein [Thalassotalea aquiviva]|uniref:DUF2375 family protein n=1 Tax=Thalassotalea aquiviva TaxID=3242415 RepID=UPI00352B1359